MGDCAQGEKKSLRNCSANRISKMDDINLERRFGSVVRVIPPTSILPYFFSPVKLKLPPSGSKYISRSPPA